MLYFCMCYEDYYTLTTVLILNLNPAISFLFNHAAAFASASAYSSVSRLFLALNFDRQTLSLFLPLNFCLFLSLPMSRSDNLNSSIHLSASHCLSLSFSLSIHLCLSLLLRLSFCPWLFQSLCFEHFILSPVYLSTHPIISFDFSISLSYYVFPSLSPFVFYTLSISPSTSCIRSLM